MMSYKLLRQKAFETMPKFEKRLNQEAKNGWKPYLMSTNGHVLVVMLERNYA
jgi:hypothetical protein